MNKSLEKIRDEANKLYVKSIECDDSRINIGLSTAFHNGFNRAIATLRCENCKHSEKVDDCFYCCYAAFVTKDFGCTEFEKKESGV